MLVIVIFLIFVSQGDLNLHFSWIFMRLKDFLKFILYKEIHLDNGFLLSRKMLEGSPHHSFCVFLIEKIAVPLTTTGEEKLFLQPNLLNLEEEPEN